MKAAEGGWTAGAEEGAAAVEGGRKEGSRGAAGREGAGIGSISIGLHAFEEAVTDDTEGDGAGDDEAAAGAAIEDDGDAAAAVVSNIFARLNDALVGRADGSAEMM